MAGGQPTKYTPEMPAKYVELCKKGGSTPQFCRDVEISKQTFYEWCSVHPEMMKAKEEGKVFAEAWWLDQSHQNLLQYKDGPKIDAKLYTFICSGRFGHTSDRSLAKRIAALEEKVEQTPEASSKGAFAEEAAYTVEDDNKA